MAAIRLKKRKVNSFVVACLEERSDSITTNDKRVRKAAHVVSTFRFDGRFETTAIWTHGTQRKLTFAQVLSVCTSGWLSLKSNQNAKLFRARKKYGM